MSSVLYQSYQAGIELKYGGRTVKYFDVTIHGVHRLQILSIPAPFFFLAEKGFRRNLAIAARFNRVLVFFFYKKKEICVR